MPGIRFTTSIWTAACLVLLTTSAASDVPDELRGDPAVSLRGSPASMQEQHSIAQGHELDFYRTADEIQAAVQRGKLAPLSGNEDYVVADFARHPYVQPEVVLFVERLAAQYRRACREQLVVTSASRAIEEQPPNAHALSVHPSGMAVDFRVSTNADCRAFMERAIRSLDGRGLINGIREHSPPHYHIAVYPLPYAEYAAERLAVEEEEQARLERLAEMRRREIAAETAPSIQAIVWEAALTGAAPPVTVYVALARLAVDLLSA